MLVTTDFSPLENLAIPHAYAAAAKPGGTVVLCHVVELEPTPNPLYAHYTPGKALTAEERRHHEKEIAKALRALIPPDAAEAGVASEVRVVEQRNSVAEAIRLAAEEAHADLVVISSHGRSDLAQMLFGSVSEEVTRSLRVPVLVVRGRSAT
jgi:nucleotide-binding universal stress UspA family protein